MSSDTPAPPTPGSQPWLDQVVEDVIDPERVIVDPHHHLWPPGGALPYGLAELLADVGTGHNIARTVFVECGAAYDHDEPEHRASLGETRFVSEQASGDRGRLIHGIVASVDLRRDDLDELLDAHTEASNGLLRGIRHALSSADHPEALAIPGRAPRDLAHDPAFRRGVARLGERGLTYDSWHYHYQNQDFLDLARAAPGTTMVLDHFGTPLGVGPYADQRHEIQAQWRADIAAIAGCENVVAKLGGLAMPDNGYGWHSAPRPPTSDEFVAAQGDAYHHTIDQFGPARCMFESNFPVDRFSVSYRVLWNAFKKMASRYSPDEQAAMFSATADGVYRLV